MKVTEIVGNTLKANELQNGKCYKIVDEETYVVLIHCTIAASIREDDSHYRKVTYACLCFSDKYDDTPMCILLDVFKTLWPNCRFTEVRSLEISLP